MTNKRCVILIIVAAALVLWQVLHLWFLTLEASKSSLMTFHIAAHANDWNALIKGNDSYYAQDMVELKQFHKAKLKFNRKSYGLLLEDYRYNVDSACIGDANGIAIVIYAKHTQGGSSFRIMSSSVLRQTCSFEDYFNGSYVAFCLLNRADCTNVTIYLMYVDYKAYTHKTHPKNKLIWKTTICSSSCYSARRTQRFLYPSVALQKRVELQNRMTWGLINDSLKLFIRNGNRGTWTRYQPISESDICRWVCVMDKASAHKSIRYKQVGLCQCIGYWNTENKAT